ncbi:ribosome maturation factor RimP [Ammoniphilus resinae]|uniref:Ribosome maturation factor RimP n=1 Tax=Ammoniphilus resinae TaxID=861532 RepID=A0ABS4GMP3_9BACL|nr:ribosome maturation factor RimP [Ammoniphilus resinae]MBP1931529.1 ribosome maturation factor RimP [Ammoniphilus resinae]
MAKDVINTVEQLVLPIVDSVQLELVDIEYIKEGSNWFLRVFIDKEGGVDIDDCGMVSEKLSKKLDEIDPIPTAYFLEVSSPGIERPLKKPKDFEWAVGKRISLKTKEAIVGAVLFEGDLMAFDGEQITVKEESQTLDIPIEKIESARLSVVF